MEMIGKQKGLGINQVPITTNPSLKILCHKTKPFASKQKGLGN